MRPPNQQVDQSFFYSTNIPQQVLHVSLWARQWPPTPVEKPASPVGIVAEFPVARNLLMSGQAPSMPSEALRACQKQPLKVRTWCG